MSLLRLPEILQTFNRNTVNASRSSFDFGYLGSNLFRPWISLSSENSPARWIQSKRQPHCKRWHEKRGDGSSWVLSEDEQCGQYPLSPSPILPPSSPLPFFCTQVGSRYSKIFKCTWLYSAKRPTGTRGAPFVTAGVVRTTKGHVFNTFMLTTAAYAKQSSTGRASILVCCDVPYRTKGGREWERSYTTTLKPLRSRILSSQGDTYREIRVSRT